MTDCLKAMIMWWCLRLKGKTVMMGFSLRVTCRKGTMAPNIWLLIMGPLAKCEIPTLSEWIRNKQEPPKGKVNLRRQVSRGGSADSPDQEIRKPGAESQIGVRTGWDSLKGQADDTKVPVDSLVSKALRARPTRCFWAYVFYTHCKQQKLGGKM